LIIDQFVVQPLIVCVFSAPAFVEF
jgi:hypothetical protein